MFNANDEFFVIDWFIICWVKVREDLRRANALADETSITNEELKGQLQCIYQERSAVQSIVTWWKKSTGVYTLFNFYQNQNFFFPTSVSIIIRP